MRVVMFVLISYKAHFKIWIELECGVRVGKKVLLFRGDVGAD